MGPLHRRAVVGLVGLVLALTAFGAQALGAPALGAPASLSAVEGTTVPTPCPAYDTGPNQWCLHSNVSGTTDTGPSAGTYVLHLSRSGDSSVSVSVPGRTLQAGSIEVEQNTALYGRDTANNTRTLFGEAILDQDACPAHSPSCTIRFHHQYYPNIAPGGSAPPPAWLFLTLNYEDPGDPTQLGGASEAAIQVVFDDDGGPGTDEPVARFEAAADAPGSLVWHFDATTSSTTGGATYAWTFGDGSTGTGQTPTHTYAAAGDYDVTLRLTDSGGSSDPVTHTVHVGRPALVVNSAGDQAANATALSHDVCDIRASSPVGSETCTLRAALMLANQRDAAQAITFAIPGAGTPTISPATALPPATAPVSVDGTTQQGGWVVLSGAATSGAVDGLEVDGAASTVRGLVVNGFAQGAGIVAGGIDGGHVIAGNRVGTNPAGLGSVPNKIGILVTGPDVTVGGTAGTAALACTGDCNLVGGNTVAQVTNFEQLPGVTGSPPLVAIRVIGNWVGIDGSGESALPSPDDSVGIDLAFGNPLAGHVDDRVVIGGASPTPGRAPGNLVAGVGTAIAVQDETTTAGVPRGRTTVAGNLVGEDATGGRALGHGSYGIGTVGGGAGSILVGGSGAGAGNVVGGRSIGIYVNGNRNAVIGNRIGTDVTGTSAVPNDVGVQGGRLIGNLVSGNGIGVHDGSAHLEYGNLVGLDASGTRALPNDVGIGAPADHEPGFHSVYVGTDVQDPAPVCSVSPCNVISGNTTAGIRLPGEFATLHLAGTFIGTDVSGTRAVPNGVGVLTSARFLKDTAVGGASGAASGRGCRYPCNVIAGNTGTGMVVNAVAPDDGDTTHPDESGWVSGNYLGVGADGNALPNGGAQLTVTGVPAVDDLTVGGDIERGNLFATGFAAGSPPALQIGGSATTYPAVTASGNRFNVPGPGAAITRPSSTVNPPILSSVTPSAGGITVTGSTNVAADPTKAPEQIELYAVSSCDVPGTYAPIATGSAAILSGDFSITVSARALAGTTGIYAVRTDQAHSTSRLSTCLSGPRITTATRPLARGAQELEVASNTGWAAGDYAQVETAGGPVVRRVAALGSLVFAAPLPAAVAAGAAVVQIAPPLGDVTAPKVKAKAQPRGAVRRGSKLVVHLKCTDTHGVGVESCPTKVRLSTKKPGRHHLVVTVWDRNGNARTVKLKWKVARP